MNILSIDDRSEIQELKLLGLPYENVLLTGRDMFLYEVALKVKRQTQQGAWVLFINLFLDCKDTEFPYQQNQAGIALLKYLRLIDVNHHIVLISPYSFDHLIRQCPGNLIISSLGITITQSAYDFDEFDSKRLEELSNITFKSDLKPFILTEFHLPEDERHNWANWWGVKQLYEVHRHVRPEESNALPSLPYKDKLHELRNVQAAVLYGHSLEDLNTAVFQNILAQKERDKADLSKQIEWCLAQESITDKGRINPKTITDKIEYLTALIDKDENNEVYQDNGELRQQIESLEKELEAVKCEKEKITLRLTELEGELSELKNSGAKGPLHDCVQNMKTDILQKVRSRCPKILFIDDQAEEGWSDVLQTVIYGTTKGSDFILLVPDINDVKHLNQYYETTINPHIPNVDMIILDLRLNKESKIGKNVENMAGSKLLQKIRKDYPGLPVLMATASNKIWTYEKLMHYGMDAYWIKEGLDVSSSLNSSERARWSVTNYFNLIRSIETLTDERYQFLHKYWSGVLQLEKKNNLWWENKLWPDGCTTKARRDVVFALLKDVTQMVRMYINQFQFDIDEMFWASAIIQRFGSVLEEIHRFDLLKDGCRSSGTIGSYKEYGLKPREVRRDWFGFKLYLIRNKAAHLAKNEKNIDWKLCCDFCKNMLCYLEHGPQDVFYYSSTLEGLRNSSPLYKKSYSQY